MITMLTRFLFSYTRYCFRIELVTISVPFFHYVILIKGDVGVRAVCELCQPRDYPQ